MADPVLGDQVAGDQSAEGAARTGDQHRAVRVPSRCRVGAGACESEPGDEQLPCPEGDLGLAGGNGGGECLLRPDVDVDQQDAVGAFGLGGAEQAPDGRGDGVGVVGEGALGDDDQPGVLVGGVGEELLRDLQHFGETGEEIAFGLDPGERDVLRHDGTLRTRDLVPTKLVQRFVGGGGELVGGHPLEAEVVDGDDGVAGGVVGREVGGVLAAAGEVDAQGGGVGGVQLHAVPGEGHPQVTGGERVEGGVEEGGVQGEAVGADGEDDLGVEVLALLPERGEPLEGRPVAVADRGRAARRHRWCRCAGRRWGARCRCRARGCRWGFR